MTLKEREKNGKNEAHKNFHAKGMKTKMTENSELKTQNGKVRNMPPKLNKCQINKAY